MSKDARMQLEDIQAIILRGYPKLRSACYLLLTIDQPKRCLEWLTRAVLDRVVSFQSQPEECALNIAFGYSGLQQLGIPETTLHSFSRPFKEGMSVEHRQRSLGDHGESAPDRWLWGGEADRVDILLLCFANSDQRLEQLITDLGLQHTESQQANGFS